MSVYYISATWYIMKVRLCKNSVSVGTKQHVWAHTKHCHSRINNIRRLYSRLGFPQTPWCPTRAVTLTSPPGRDTQNGWAQQKKQKVYQCFSQQANAELQLICTIKLISFVVHTKANYINIPRQARETF